MSLTYRALTLNFSDGAQRPVSRGRITIAPSQMLTDVTGAETTLAVPVLVDLADNPNPTVTLLTTDSTDVTPSGWYWVITGLPGSRGPVSFDLPYGDGSAIDFSAVTRVDPAPPVSIYLPVPSGDPLAGYAPVVIADGSPATQWAPGGGGGGAVASVFGRIGGVTAHTGDYTVSQVTGAASSSGLAAETTRAQAAEALLAPLASPALTGTPTAPSAPPMTGNTQVASTAYADAAVAVEASRAVTAEAQLAPNASPTFTGTPTAPTATALTNTTQVSTTAYADAAVAVEATNRSNADALKAPLASPALTGTPTAPTATALTNTTQVSTTAYTDAAVAVEATNRSNADALKAPLASPALTGTPTAPTATALTNTTQVSTTAYADAAVAVENSRATTAEALKAPLASPALTGNPTAPTQAALNNSTRVSTTAYADAAVAVENSRATTAEALKAPLASPTFTGTVTLPATVNATDAAQKQYVDSVAAGLTTKQSVTALASSNISLSGTQTIDGVAVTAAQRVLATGQTTASQNGIWVVASGSWTRPTDFAAGSSQTGAFVFVEAGTVNAASGWVLTGATAVTVDTTAQTWTQFSGAGEITAGTNLSKSGNTLSVIASPALTGTPTAPTATALTNTTQIATTAYADAATAVEATNRSNADALKAPLASPALTGTPTAPTASALTNTTQVSTTAYTDAAVAVENSRATTAEALKAPLASPALTGNPTAPTQAALNNSTRVATTAYTDAAVAVENSRATTAEALKAPLASPALTGTPTAPTATALTNTTQVSTTAYADAAVAVENSRATTAEALKAPLASPALTGNPTAPTQTALNSSTRVATTAYADAAITALQKQMPVVFNVKNYGAVGNGSTDDTAAIQSAIDASTGAAAPASNTRTSLGPVYLPPGTYKVTADLIIRSVSGFKFYGDDPGTVTINASGTGFTQAVIFINGSLDGSYGGFALQGDGTEKCGSNDLYNGIRLDWIQASKAVANCGTTNASAVVTTTDAQVSDVGATVTGTGIPASTTVSSVVPGTSWTLSHNATATGTATITIASVNAAARSTTGNKFQDIRVRALKADTLFSLEGNGAAQVDGTNFDNVIVSGAQTVGSWSSTGLYTKGFGLGNGVFANNYNHVFKGSSATGCYNGFHNNASSFALFGSQPAGNQCDFYLNPGSQTTIENVQTQSCGTFISTPAMFAPIPVSVVDCFIKTANASLASQVMLTLNGGIWNFKNLVMTNITSGASFVPGAIAMTGTTSGRPVIATFQNLVNNATRTATFTTLTNAVAIVHNYSNYAPATGIYAARVAGDLSSVYDGAWIATDTSVAPAQVTWLNTAGTSTYTIPTGSTTIEAMLQAGGGGGGSGCLAASGQAGGGAGGNAGGYSRQTFSAADLGASVSVTVGDGGAGGAQVLTRADASCGTTNGSTTVTDSSVVSGDVGRAVTGTGIPAGANINSVIAGTSFVMSAAATATGTVTVTLGGGRGAAGTQSLFGTVLHANGGGGGSGGTIIAGGTIGVTVGTGWSQWGSNAGGGGTSAAGAAGAAPTVSQSGASGGGGGAGTTGAATGNGGATQIPAIGGTGNTAAGGVAGGASPGTGTQPTVKGIPSCGGGGGASAFGSNAVAQDGAQPFNGGGGGGGGGCAGGGTAAAGAGGKGGVGFVLIIASF